MIRAAALERRYVRGWPRWAHIASFLVSTPRHNIIPQDRVCTPGHDGHDAGSAARRRRRLAVIFMTALYTLGLLLLSSSLLFAMRPG